ncbi:MAG: hypothetical protein HYW97_01180, partial [Candidatus Wildermuthbacteria bacterium]|nr:hypothetical protein [Candidatus Wildermuthbacteria bacterium]
EEVELREEAEPRPVGREAAPERSSASAEAPRELLKAKDEMIQTLQGVVETKDNQIVDLSKKIDQLIERDRETNFLLKGLQDRIFLLEKGKKGNPR